MLPERNVSGEVVGEPTDVVQDGTLGTITEQDEG